MAADDKTPIAGALERAGISKKEAARRLAVIDEKTESSWLRDLNRYAKGETEPDKKNAALLARVLGGHAEDFLTTRVHRSESIARSLTRRVESIDSRLVEVETTLQGILEETTRLADAVASALETLRDQPPGEDGRCPA